MENRRDVASRGKMIFHKLSKMLIQLGLTPNMISVASVLFALLAGVGLYLASFEHHILGLILALIGIQLRLVCNLIDGLMAVEGGLSSPAGELYNDVPDRFSDWFIILSMGFLAIKQYEQAWVICWVASTFAILTAYIRVLGASMGAGHNFNGPMAKQHRMAVVNVSIVFTALEVLLMPDYLGLSMLFGACVIAIGSLATCFKRLVWIGRQLKDKPSS